MTRRRALQALLGCVPWPTPPAWAQPGAAATTPRRSLLEPLIGQDWNPELAAEYFGTHLHRLVLKPAEKALATEWPHAQIGALRLWDSDTRWGDVAPRAGAWSFDRMDAYVDRAVAEGASVVYTLGSTPRWASARPDEPGAYGPGCAAEPIRLAHWEEYVARVANRYRGRIRAYELWNEPTFADFAVDRQHPGFFTGTAEAMVVLARAARRVLDQVDPPALLTTPGFVNGPHRLDLFLSRGGAEFVQAVAYHFYARDSAQFAQQITEVRHVMRERGVAGLPLWNTECGVETYAADEPLPEGVAERITPGAAAIMMARFLLLGAALGLPRFFYYAWDSERSGLVDRHGQPTPRARAWRRVMAWCQGARLSPPRRVEACGWAIAGVRQAEQFLIVWNDGSPPAHLTLPVGWRAASFEALMSDAVVPMAATAPFRLRLPPAPLRVNLVPA
jgi:hypothetical protein